MSNCAQFVMQIPEIAQLCDTFCELAPYEILERVLGGCLRLGIHEPREIYDYVMEDTVDGLLEPQCDCHHPDCPYCQAYESLCDQVFYFVERTIDKIHFQGPYWHDLQTFYEGTDPCYLTIQPIDLSHVLITRPNYQTMKPMVYSQLSCVHETRIGLPR